jgi:hypothetical protein
MSRKEIGPSLEETLADTQLPSLLVEYTEVALDTLLVDGVVKDIPIIGTLRGLWKSGVIVRDYLFVRKLLRFLGPLSEVPHEERVKMIERLHEDESYFHRVGDEILLLLDRLDSIKKAQYVGRAFRAYCKGYIDNDMLQRINYAVDKVLLGDLPKLAQFAATGHADDAVLQGFVNAGLAHIPPGTASTYALPIHPICDAMLKHVLRD